MRIRRYKGGKLLPHRLRMKPEEVRTITLDLRGEIGTTAIASATWGSEPDGLTIGAATTTDQETQASVTAPDSEGDYDLTITITTASETIETRLAVAVTEDC
jgi:hypothetical protein